MRTPNRSLLILALCGGLYACAGESNATDELPPDAAADTPSDQETTDVGPDVDAGAETDTNTCSSPTLLCQGLCIDPEKDHSNCGTCGKICDLGQVCSAGKCDIVCSGGTEKCGNVCVDTQLDKNNCGTCGKVCDSGQVCSAGKCDLVCSGGTEKCGSLCVDTKLNTNNCGTCGKLCGAGEVCSSGKCDLVCSGGTEKCGSACFDTKTDSAHCGACDSVCPSGETCIASKCEIVCTGGTSKCGTLCLNLQTDPKNCGKCGTVCEESAICDAGHCKTPFPVGMFCLPSFPDLVGFSETKDMVMGDFNQDNLADLVVNGRLALARGNGSFKSVILSETLPYGAQSVVSDLNGDGLLDLVSADDVGHRIGVALNKGDLSFQIAYYDVAVKPTFLAAGDLNGDGKPEVVFVAKYADVLGVMSNLGDGTLSAPKLTGVEPHPTVILIGDFDGDKLNDVLHDVLLKGDGKGGLTPLAAGYLPGGHDQALSYDFDGDGDLDLILADYSSVGLARNDGAGNFQFASTEVFYSSAPYGSLPPHLGMADLNADGKMDAVVSQLVDTWSGHGWWQLATFMNVGKGKFEKKLVFKDSIDAFAVGDITGDGKPELVGEGGGYENATLQVLRNKGDGAFAVPDEHPGHDFSGYSITADLDSDGKFDVAVANYYTKELLVYYNSGKGGFLDPLVFPTATEPYRIVTGDANTDGKTDLVVTGKTWASLYLGNGKTLASPIPLSWFPSTMDATGELAFSDINGDGKRDIITTASTPPYGYDVPYVFLGNGDGTFQPFKKLSDSTTHSFGTADLNKDGRADFYASDSSTLRIWTSNADATISLLGEYPYPMTYPMTPAVPIAADVDGDSIVDLATIGTILYGKNDGTYEKVSTSSSFLFDYNGNLSQVSVADMNQDGLLDLLASDNMDTNSVRVLLNQGGRKFSREFRFRTNRHGSAGVFGTFNLIDINNDGALDLITDGGMSFKGMRFLLNGCGI